MYKAAFGHIDLEYYILPMPIMTTVKIAQPFTFRRRSAELLLTGMGGILKDGRFRPFTHVFVYMPYVSVK